MNLKVNVKKLPHSMINMMIIVPVAEVSAALDRAYENRKENFPHTSSRKEVEEKFGKDTFVNDALNDVCTLALGNALAQEGIEIVSAPQIDLLEEQTKHMEEQDLIFSVTAAVTPEVRLFQYKGLTVKAPKMSYTDEELEDLYRMAAQKKISYNAVNRKAAMGDRVHIDYRGTVDSVAFEGGTGSYDLVLGSGSFIPGFEEQLVGASAGDDVTVNVTFPNEYHAPNLAGAAAVFECHVHTVEEAAASALTDSEKASVKASATSKLEAEAEDDIIRSALALIAASSPIDIPDAMIDLEVQVCMGELEQQMAQSGMDLDSLSQISGKSKEQIADDIMRPQAMERIQARLIFNAIAEAEGFTANDADLAAQFQMLSDMWGIDADKVRDTLGENGVEQLKKEILIDKAMVFLRKNIILE